MTSDTANPATDGHGSPKVDDSHHTHVCSAFLFTGVFVALLFLTFVTVFIAQFDFGGANMLIAMGVAAVKASLVLSVFMHLKWDTAINNIAFLGSLIFLSLLFLFTLADHGTRGDADAGSGVYEEYATPPEFVGDFQMTGHPGGH